MMTTHEICQSEVHYVKSLSTLIQEFIRPMQQEFPQVLQDAQAAVFCNNLDQLIVLNSKLRDDLMQESTTDTIGTIFCRYAPLFKVYASFAKDFDDVTKLFRSVPGLTDFLKVRKMAKMDGTSRNPQSFRQTREDSAGHTFESLLIRPIQRIPRYRLLLNVRRMM